MLRSLMIVLCLSVCAVGCDRSADAPEQQRNAKKDDQGNAWRGLMQQLAAAPSDDAKIAMLERFIAAQPEHPDVGEAQRRLAELKDDPGAAAKKLVAELAQKAIEEGQPVALVTLFASESVRQASNRLQRDELATPVTVPTLDGNVEVAKALFVHPLVLRGHIRRALVTHASDKVEKRCNRQCINEALGKILAGSIGGPLFLEDGKMNPDAVGPLLEKSWIDPEAEMLGLPSRTWYAIFAPTFHAYVSVQRAIADADPKGGAAKLAALSDAKEISEFYTSWTDGAHVVKETGLPPSDARAIAGWWLRRHADGTAPLFEAHIVKVIEGYEPELAAK